ncbi:MAG: hypothetical protein ACODAQ_05515 [Phycisphaeraceae bacterium]
MSADTSAPSAHTEEPVDELTRAKLRLLARNEPAGEAERGSAAMDAPQQMLRQHPFLAVAAALAGGFLIMRVGILRKLAIGAALWGGKRLVTAYLRGR